MPLESEQRANITYSEEAIRKAVHVFSIIIPVCYFFIPRLAALLILLAAAITAVTFDLSRITDHPIWTRFGRYLFGRMIRPKEKEGFTGASYILSTDFLVILLFSKPVAICAIAFIALGDTAAAMVGRQWGYHRFGDKSYEGSFGFFITAVGVALFCNYIYGDSLPIIVGVTGATVATLVEALSHSSDDNMTVPLISGIFMQICVAVI